MGLVLQPHFKVFNLAGLFMIVKRKYLNAFDFYEVLFRRSLYRHSGSGQPIYHLKPLKTLE